MKLAATKAGTAFGQLLDTAKREPRARVKWRHSDDALWGEQACAPMAEGYIGPDASQKLLDRLLNAEG